MTSLQWNNYSATGVLGIKYEVILLEWWTVIIRFGSNSISYTGFAREDQAKGKCQAFNDFLDNQRKEVFDEGFSEGHMEGTGGPY